MGGAASRFSETDWDAVDGHLKKATDTLDGCEPTPTHTIVTLTKQSRVNQRAYDVHNDQGSLLYTTQGVQGTSKWFDVLGKDQQKLFRVQTDMLRVSWDVLAYGKPCFDGQQPDAEASEKAGERLYRRAKIIITWDKHHGHVYLCGGNHAGDTDPAGVVKEEDAILKVEEIRSVTAQYQSFIPKGPIDVPHPSLVGHWVWENTVHVHRMKMHLAKRTDTCLHCIVAVVTNMVQLERSVEGTE